MAVTGNLLPGFLPRLCRCLVEHVGYDLSFDVFRCHLDSRLGRHTLVYQPAEEQRRRRLVDYFLSLDLFAHTHKLRRRRGSV